MLSWKPKAAEILSDGTLRYRDLPDASSSDSDTDGGDDGFARLLLPYGASLLSREAQMEIGKLPKGCVASAGFVLRTRGGARKLRFVAEDGDAEKWCAAADVAARAAVLDGHCPMMDVFEGEAGPDGMVARSEVEGLLKYANFKGEVDLDGVGERVGYAQFLTVLRKVWLTEGVQKIWAELGGVECGVKEVALWMDVAQEVVWKELEERGIEGDEDSGAVQIDPVLLQALICNKMNDACDPSALALGDLSQSMSSYFINSSHNTYLEGDQLQGDSSAAMYRMVLEAGARCVEIDMWDSDDGPIVTHGHTRCGKVPLREVAAAIGKAAFVASEYPVILSLENHLSGPMQLTAAAIFKEELGDALDVVGVAEGEMLPSPESLKGKILIKAKMGKWAHRADSGNAERSEEDSDDDDEGKGKGAAEFGGSEMASDSSGSERESASASPTTSCRGGGFFSSMKVKWTRSKEKSEKKKSPEKKKKKSIVVVKELADLTSFGGANRKHLCALWVTGGMHPVGQLSSDIVSINESKIADLVTEGQGRILQSYNNENITRVYPKGTRVDSSNYSPLVGWAAGCQITALNFQTGDVGMWLNQGRFKVNGGSGYVLKSAPAGEGVRNIEGSGTLDVKILFGSLLPKLTTGRSYDVADPYVQVTLMRVDSGVPEDIVRRTKQISGNGLSPVWNEKVGGFHVTDAHMDMLLISVWDEDLTSADDMIGFYAAPVHALRTGTRCFNLLTSEGLPLRLPGTYMYPSIVCEINWNPAPSTGVYSKLTLS